MMNIAYITVTVGISMMDITYITVTVGISMMNIAYISHNRDTNDEHTLYLISLL
jgi:hypothetical protein